MSDAMRGWFILAVLIAAGWLVYLLGPVLTPFLVSAGVAYLCDPIVDRLERVRVRKWTIGRTGAVIIVFFVLVAIVTLALVFILPALVRQAQQLVERFPEWLDWLEGSAWPWVAARLGLDASAFDTTHATDLLRQYWREVSGAAVDVMGAMGRGGKVVLTLVTNLVLVPVVTFYLLRDWDLLMKRLQGLLPRSRVNMVNKVAGEIDEVLGAFLRGQFVVMMALGVVYAIGLSVLGLEGAFLIGMGAGLLSIVPYLGSIVGLAVAVGVALFQFGDILHVALVLVVFGVGQSLEGMVLTPKLVGDRIGLHPVTVIFAVLAGGQLFGFVGILLALPVAAALNVVVRHLQDIYQHSEWYRVE
jgi:predicted PurR-regulated permease PerM